MELSDTVLQVGWFNAIPSRPPTSVDRRDHTVVSLRDRRTGAFHDLLLGNPPVPRARALSVEVCEENRRLCVRALRPWGEIAADEGFTLAVLVLGSLAGGGMVTAAVAFARNARRTLLRQLRRALATGKGLSLAYQPILDLYTRRCNRRRGPGPVDRRPRHRRAARRVRRPGRG